MTTPLLDDCTDLSGLLPGCPDPEPEQGPTPLPAHCLLAQALALHLIAHPGILTHGPVARLANGYHCWWDSPWATRWCVSGLYYRLDQDGLLPALPRFAWTDLQEQFNAWGGLVCWYEGVQACCIPGSGAMSIKRTEAEVIAALIEVAAGRPVPLDYEPAR